MFGKALTSGKLLVSATAAAVDPTLITGGALTIEALSALYEKLQGNSPKLDKLSNALTNEFKANLASAAFDKPEGARTLLPKMLEHAANHVKFLDKHFVAQDIYDEIEQQLRASLDPDIYTAQHFSKFADLLLPLLITTCDDPRLKEALQMPILRAQLGGMQELLNRMGGIEKLLANPDTLSIEDLQTIVTQFEGPTSSNKSELKSYLTLKAEEYRSYRAQIDSLDERIAAISNLKGAAQDAAENLNFDEVEELLSRVSEVEAEIFAETCVTRAQNALLRNRADDAFRIFSAAADAFAAVDLLEPTRRRNAYANQLYNHGLRYGGTGLLRAADMLQATRDFAKAHDPNLWAMTTQNLAIALQTQASRTEGEAGTALLKRAVAAYEDPLTVYTKAEHPVDWAMTSQNLAGALRTHASRTGGDVGTALLKRAVTAYEDALTVYTKAEHPLDWAATTQNLAIALRNQASRTDGEAGTVLLKRAVTAYEDALTVRTRAEHPQKWAETQENLAILYAQWPERDDGQDPTAKLQTALEHVSNALKVYDPEHTSFYFHKATKLKAAIEAELEPRSGG